MRNGNASARKIWDGWPDRETFYIDLIGEFEKAGVEEICCASFDRAEDLQRVDEEIINFF